MSNHKRIDQLLDEALASGIVPAGASPSERAEIEELLAIGEGARSLGASVGGESRESLLTARARFERHVASETSRAAPAPRDRRGLLGRVAGAHRGLTAAGSAAVISLVVVGAVLAAQSFGGVDSASAQVLNADDYAQLQGVITATAGTGADRTATLSSDFGDIEIALGGLSAVTRAEGVVDPATLKAGDSVTVAGTVAKNSKGTRMEARSLSVVRVDAKPPAKARLTSLRELRRGLEGKITVLAVARDGRSARVLVDAGEGGRLVIAVNAKTLGELLNGTGPAVGREVAVSQEPGSAKGEFSLTPVSSLGPPSPPFRSGLSGVAGTVVGREGNLLRVQTNRGAMQVLVAPETRIVIGPGAELTAERFRGGNLVIGHAVIIQGGVDRATGRLVADVIWVGTKTAR